MVKQDESLNAFAVCSSHTDSPLKKFISRQKKFPCVQKKPNFFEKSGFYEKFVFQINGELVSYALKRIKPHGLTNRIHDSSVFCD